MNFDDEEVINLYKEIDELEEKKDFLIYETLTKNDKFVG